MRQSAVGVAVGAIFMPPRLGGASVQLATKHPHVTGATTGGTCGGARVTVVRSNRNPG